MYGQHLQHLKLVFEELTSVGFLEQNISKEGIHLSQNKVVASKDFDLSS